MRFLVSLHREWATKGSTLKTHTIERGSIAHDHLTGVEHCTHLVDRYKVGDTIKVVDEDGKQVQRFKIKPQANGFYAGRTAQ